VADFFLSTSTGSKGYSSTNSDYMRCRQDIVNAVRRGESVNIGYSSLSNVEAVAGRLPDDVRSRLGMQ